MQKLLVIFRSLIFCLCFFVPVFSSLHAQPPQDKTNLLLQIPPLIARGNTISSAGGVFFRNGKALTGFGGCTDIWHYEGCPNITRGTETSTGNIRWDDDIDKLVQTLVDYHFALIPIYEGLWHDSGSYDHQVECLDPYGTDEVYALPYARSHYGKGCDGRSKFDLSKFNQPFFDRYAQLAAAAEKKGLIVDIALFNQHKYLETDAHYQDQPWRPQNNVNSVSLASYVPAANSFYDNSANRQFQRAYIRKMLKTIEPYRKTVLLTLAEEYTGGSSFVSFFINTVRQWESDHSLPYGSIHIELAAPKDVLDYILSTRKDDIFAINLRYFFYQNGQLFRPSGGQEIPGRYSIGLHEFDGAANSTADEIHQKTLSYRKNYPEKIILDQIQGNYKQCWAFFMAKGSILVQENIGFPGRGRYGRPIQASTSRAISKVTELAGKAYKNLIPADNLASGSENWCLAAKNSAYIVYVSQGGSFSLDLRNDSGYYTGTWVSPRSGATIGAGTVLGGGMRSFSVPDGVSSYVLVLK